MQYVYIASVIGILLGSFLVWKRKLNLFIAALASSIMAVVFLLIGLYIDAQIYYATPGDHTAGMVFSFFMFFGSIFIFVGSFPFFIILGLIQLGLKNKK